MFKIFTTNTNSDPQPSLEEIRTHTLQRKIKHIIMFVKRMYSKDLVDKRQVTSSVSYPRCLSWITGPAYFQSGSGILIKELKYFNKKIIIQKAHPGSGSGFFNSSRIPSTALGYTKLVHYCTYLDEVPHVEAVANRRQAFCRKLLVQIPKKFIDL